MYKQWCFFSYLLVYIRLCSQDFVSFYQVKAVVFSSLFISITGTPVEIVIASIGPISNDIVKMLLKTKGRKKNKHRNIALLAISKLNGK